MATQEALWTFGELRRDLYRASDVAAALERCFGRLVAPIGRVDQEVSQLVAADELAEQLGELLVACGVHTGRLQRCLASAKAIRTTTT